MAIRAVRGAIQVDADERDQLLEATAELVREVLSRNELTSDELVSVVLTATPDLVSEFPAYAARMAGLHDVPLLSATEIAVPGAMPRVIRTMVHYYAPVGHKPEHVYLGATQELRADLHAAQ